MVDFCTFPNDIDTLVKSSFSRVSKRRRSTDLVEDRGVGVAWN